MSHDYRDADPTPMIETERLILRKPELEDLDRWTEMMADADSAKFIGGAVSPPIVWRILMQIRGAWELTGISMFSVIEKRRRVWIGRVGPWRPLGWPGDEVGWGLHPDAGRQGYALEAAIASIDYAFDTLGWKTVIHCINPLNEPSRALARRLGARILRQDTMVASFGTETVDVWGQDRGEWTFNRDNARQRLAQYRNLVA
jgi:RimJ/RimL family protein N-acetyltransferase